MKAYKGLERKEKKMTKTALEKAQEALERFEKELIGEGPSQTGEIAIGWAVIEIATQIGRIAKQLEGLRKDRW